VVKLNIRIPHEQIKHFDIDVNMSQLVLGTSAGHVYIYDLPKALENERILAKKRLDLGVEDEIVHTYLDRVHHKEFMDYNQGASVNKTIIAQTLADPLIPALPVATC
jgi:hypothetical protein